MKQIAMLFFIVFLVSLPVISGTIYEWKDPETGKLMAGDKLPTGGVKYWLEGQRPNPKSEQRPQSTEPDSSAKNKNESEKPIDARVATQEEIDQCLQIIKVSRSWKDPDSLKVEGTTTFSTLADGRTQIIMDVNAKNSYGAYAGSKIAICKYKINGQLDQLLIAP